MYFTTFYNYLKAYPITDTCNAYYACLCVCVWYVICYDNETFVCFV